jgi:TolB protein
MDSIPPAFLHGEGIDYALWDRLGADWLLTGQVEGAGSSFVLLLELHDVIYGQVKSRGRFNVPEPTHADFRLAVHRASDEVVQWTFQEPGMAASRIAFSMGPVGAGIKELYLIDSDGENLQRLTNYGDLVLSPAWSPDGGRVAYTSYHATGNAELFERDLRTGRERKIDAVRDGVFMTPAYHPDGETLAFSVQGGTRSGLFTYNVSRGCCLTNLTESTRVELSPTFSPDGRRVAFNSNRFGDAVPQIFVMPAGGGAAELVSPYVFGQKGYYTSPQWSPRGDLIVFHGRVDSGPFQILVARMGERGRLTQLTWEGQNEDPSWAPDGRHLVFRGERRWGKGLFVVDTVTGNIRPIVSNMEVSTPQWSPALRQP